MIKNKTAKYLRYAIGEVILIMVGIYMALQLNNWNQKRLQETAFKTSLEQLYNTITDEHELFRSNSNLMEQNIEAIDFLLNKKLIKYANGYPYTLWSLSFSLAYEGHSQSIQLIDKLEYNPQNSNHKSISRQLQGYANLIGREIPFKDDYISKINNLLLENNIPYPGFDAENIQAGFQGDSSFYSNDQFNKVIELMSGEYLTSLLKTERTAKTFQLLVYRERTQEAAAMLRIIKKYDPDVKLLIQDVGIIGTSINGYDDVGAKSTPMLLIDEKESIWEIEMYLKVGTVKFRCRDSWAVNWGGNSFPNGEAWRHGPDIIIDKAGNYKVLLNVSKNSYEFIYLNQNQ